MTKLLAVAVGQIITVRSRADRTDGLTDVQQFHARITAVGTHWAEYERLDTIAEENVLRRTDGGGFSRLASPATLARIGITLTTESDEWERVGTPAVERAKREILADIARGTVPATVGSFSELHDFVDANEYGGATEGDFDASDEACAFWKRVQGELNCWLEAGRP